MTSHRNTPPSSIDQNSAAQRGGLADKAAKMDLSATQIVGGALAAMTAAALGSRLGVAGTISGAAVASIIAGVAGSFYTASLRHTSERVATVLTSRREQPGAAEVEASEVAAPLATAPLASTSRRRLRFPVHTVLAAAVATFALALVALTGLESLAGGALSGGTSTTIEQVTKPEKTTKQSSDNDDAKADDTASPSESGNATPEVSETEPTNAPSERPSPSGEASPTDEDTPTTQRAEPSDQPGPTDKARPNEKGQPTEKAEGTEESEGR